MIICGYPCIGKSSIATAENGILDLESSYFKVPNKDNFGWEQRYCTMAKEQSDRGYLVFTSTHKIVRDTFTKLNIPFSLCYPDLSLKDIWIQRAFERATTSGLKKDNLAWERIRDYYDYDINELMSYQADQHFVITEVPYDIKDIVL